MILVGGAIHHVLHAVGEHEHAQEHVPVSALEFAVHHTAPILERELEVFDEGPVVDRLVLQGIGGDRPAQGLAQTVPFGQFLREVPREADVHRGGQSVGIEVQGFLVHDPVGFEVQQLEARGAHELHQWIHR